MRPSRKEPDGSGDLFRARLDQIINMRHELVRLGQKIDWDWIDEELSGFYRDTGRPAAPTRFLVGLLLLKHLHGLSDEGVCERWVNDPCFQHFTGETFFQHDLPHERSGLSHWRKRRGKAMQIRHQRQQQPSAPAAALLEAPFLVRAGRPSASARARRTSPGSSAARSRSRPPTGVARTGSSCSTPAPSTATRMTAIRCAR